MEFDAGRLPTTLHDSGSAYQQEVRNLSVLITKRINLYLQIVQKPHKKKELMVANNVLKLVECLLKVNSAIKLTLFLLIKFILHTH